MKQNKLMILFFVGLLFVGFVNAADKYVTVTGAGSHNGQPGNEYTIREAIANAQPGDTFHLAIGNYDTGQPTLSFSADGTASSPITWVGTIHPDDYDVDTNSVDGTQSTVIRSNIAANAQVTMTGDYNIFKSMVFQEDASARGLIEIRGSYVTFDGVATKYPSNAASSSNHFLVVYGDHATLKHSTFRNGARTIIWVRKGSGTQADNFLMEYCTLKGASNHPPIQIMPTTNADTPSIQRPIVRNNLFIDNPYSEAIYSRYVYQFAYYNNLFIRSATPYSIDINTGNNQILNTGGGFVAYNTIIEDGNSNILFNVGLTHTKFVNNIYYSSSNSQAYLFRFDSGNGDVTTGHQFDYNMYHIVGRDFTGVSYIWGSSSGTWGASPSLSSGWVSRTGQDIHTTINVAPTFVNAAVDNYAPLDASSPQVGKGIPITQANGFWMDVTTDYFGNPRDPVHPTIGAIEYGSSGGTGGPPIVADTNMDGCISLGEISAYVGKWLQGQVTLSQTSSAVSTWMGGC